MILAHPYMGGGPRPSPAGRGSSVGDETFGVLRLARRKVIGIGREKQKGVQACFPPLSACARHLRQTTKLMRDSAS